VILASLGVPSVAVVQIATISGEFEPTLIKDVNLVAHGLSVMQRQLVVFVVVAVELHLAALVVEDQDVLMRVLRGELLDLVVDPLVARIFVLLLHLLSHIDQLSGTRSDRCTPRQLALFAAQSKPS